MPPREPCAVEGDTRCHHRPTFIKVWPELPPPRVFASTLRRPSPRRRPSALGVLAAKAGVTAPVGESGLRGTQFAVDRINAAGASPAKSSWWSRRSNPKDTVERFRKLALQTKATSSPRHLDGVGLAVAR